MPKRAEIPVYSITGSEDEKPTVSKDHTFTFEELGLGFLELTTPDGSVYIVTEADLTSMMRFF